MERDGEILVRRMDARARDRRDASAAEWEAPRDGSRDGMLTKRTDGGVVDVGTRKKTGAGDDLAGGVLAALLRREDFGGSGVGIGASLEDADRRMAELQRAQ